MRHKITSCDVNLSGISMHVSGGNSLLLRIWHRCRSSGRGRVKYAEDHMLTKEGKPRAVGGSKGFDLGKEKYCKKAGGISKTNCQVLQRRS